MASHPCVGKGSDLLGQRLCKYKVFSLGTTTLAAKNTDA